MTTSNSYVDTINLNSFLYDELYQFSKQVRDISYTYHDIDIKKDYIGFKIQDISFRNLGSIYNETEDNVYEIRAKNSIVIIQVRGDKSYKLGDEVINYFRSSNTISKIRLCGIGLTAVTNINYIPDNYTSSIIKPMVQFSLNINYNSIIDTLGYIKHLSVIVNNTKHLI